MKSLCFVFIFTFLCAFNVSRSSGLQPQPVLASNSDFGPLTADQIAYALETHPLRDGQLPPGFSEPTMTALQMGVPPGFPAPSFGFRVDIAKPDALQQIEIYIYGNTDQATS